MDDYMDLIRDLMGDAQTDDEREVFDAPPKKKLRWCVSCGSPSREDFCDFCINEE